MDGRALGTDVQAAATNAPEPETSVQAVGTNAQAVD
jgi:hypothetical protein